MALIILLSTAASKKANNVNNPRVNIMTRFLSGFPLSILLGLLLVSQRKNPSKNGINTGFVPVLTTLKRYKKLPYTKFWLSRMGGKRDDSAISIVQP
jgi:hypothetical protein